MRDPGRIGAMVVPNCWWRSRRRYETFIGGGIKDIRPAARREKGGREFEGLAMAYGGQYHTTVEALHLQTEQTWLGHVEAQPGTGRLQVAPGQMKLAVTGDW